MAMFLFAGSRAIDAMAGGVEINWADEVGSRLYTFDEAAKIHAFIKRQMAIKEENDRVPTLKRAANRKGGWGSAFIATINDLKLPGDRADAETKNAFAAAVFKELFNGNAPAHRAIREHLYPPIDGYDSETETTVTYSINTTDPGGNPAAARAQAKSYVVKHQTLVGDSVKTGAIAGTRTLTRRGDEVARGQPADSTGQPVGESGAQSGNGDAGNGSDGESDEDLIARLSVQKKTDCQEAPGLRREVETAKANGAKLKECLGKLKQVKAKVQALKAEKEEFEEKKTAMAKSGKVDPTELKKYKDTFLLFQELARGNIDGVDDNTVDRIIDVLEEIKRGTFKSSS